MGVSSLQKNLAALCLLVTGGACGDTDEYIHIDISTTSIFTIVREIFTIE